MGRVNNATHAGRRKYDAIVNQPPVATSPDAGGAALSQRQIVFMVAALVASVISFQLNATMVAPAYHAITAELGPNAFVAMSTYFYLAGAIANVVLIRWSDYIGRKRVLLAIMIVLCIGTVLCIVSTSLPLFVLGWMLFGGIYALVLQKRHPERLERMGQVFEEA